MKSRSLALILLLCLGWSVSCGKEEGGGSTTPSGGAPSGSAEKGTLTASPNPCLITSENSCATTVTWNTENVAMAEVWVRNVLAGSPSDERLFARGKAGQQSAPWIGGGSNRTEFNLYSVGSGAKVPLASISVTATR